MTRAFSRRFLSFRWFVGLLTDLFMCGGFPLAQTHCFSLLSEPWQLLQWPVFTARKFSLHGNNALEIQLFSEFCLHPSNPRFTDCGTRQILSMSGTLTRFPCSANKHACPIVRVAHLPQKPCYVILGTIAVVSYESSFAKLAFFGKRCIRSFHCFLRKQGQLH